MWEWLSAHGEALRTIFMFAAVLVALASSIAAWRATSNTLNVAEGRMLADMLEEYRKKEMCESLRYLRIASDRFNALGNDALVKVAGSYQAGGQMFPDVGYTVDMIDGARRWVDQFYNKAARLYENKYVSAKFIKEIGRLDRPNMEILKIAVKLGQAQAKAGGFVYEPDHARTFEKVCKVKIVDV